MRARITAAPISHTAPSIVCHDTPSSQDAAARAATCAQPRAASRRRSHASLRRAPAAAIVRGAATVASVCSTTAGAGAGSRADRQQRQLPLGQRERRDRQEQRARQRERPDEMPQRGGGLPQHDRGGRGGEQDDGGLRYRVDERQPGQSDFRDGHHYAPVRRARSMSRASRSSSRSESLVSDSSSSADNACSADPLKKVCSTWRSAVFLARSRPTVGR